MREKMLVSLVLVAFFAGAGLAGQYYVSPAGSDENPGTKAEPFRTIGKAVSVIKPGDSCFVREGRYHEQIVIDGLRAGEDEPVTLTSYPGEKVVLDGTVVIEARWQKFKSGIYKANISEDIWQLFVDGQLMTSARWPNANWQDESIWLRKSAWSHQAGTSKYGHLYDDAKYNDLAAAGVDFSGAPAVLNIGSWRTFAVRINEHKQGSDNFTYRTDLWDRLEDKVFWQEKKHQGWYFLECDLRCLDTAKEWFYDPADKQLYLYCDDGKSPAGRSVRGKNISYALTVRNCRNVRIKGFDFFAATFRIEHSSNITIEDCDLMYPNYSKRMLGDFGDIDVTLVDGPDDRPAGNIVRNCTFAYTDGTAMRITGRANTIENCLFHHIDYTGLGRSGIDADKAKETVFRRCTLHTVGCAQGCKPGLAGLMEFNHLYNIGYLQSDGGMFQFGPTQQPQSITRYNWCHDTPWKGLRYDGSFIGNIYGSRKLGTDGLAHHNVIWDSQTMYIKGDEHRIYHNVCFDNTGCDLVIRSLAGQPRPAGYLAGYKYPGWGPGSDHPDENANTITRNNLAGVLSSSKQHPTLGLPGLHSNNWQGDVANQVRDTANLDFRPKKDADVVDAGYYIEGVTGDYVGKSPDIGAYEYGAASYWIPGYQASSASTPVPPDGAVAVRLDADLMWLGGYKAASHDVYFGKDRETVADANRKSRQYKANQANNIFEPGKLDAGRTYYWRIDAVDKSGVVTAGDVWSFTTEGL